MSERECRDVSLDFVVARNTKLDSKYSSDFIFVTTFLLRINSSKYFLCLL